LKFLELFSGQQGTIISSLILLPIFILMWLITLHLYKRRRKKSYLTLTIALTMTLLDRGCAIWLSLGPKPGHFIKVIRIENAITCLGNCALILLILGFYQLYHVTQKRTHWIFYGLCAASCGAEIANVWIGRAFILIFIIGSLLALGGKVGNDFKFRWALGSFLLTDVIQVWNEHFMHQAANWETFLEKALPALSYSILFFLLLERVIEVMQMSYISSITDALTGLYNRRHFYLSVEKSIRTDQKPSIIFSDIDNFKRLNDTKGHKAGDDVLKQVATIVKEEVGGIGLAGRYGGEEIVAMISDPSIDMKQLTERIRFRIEKETIVTVSIGYSKLEGKGITHDVLIKQADIAMYQAKTTGKNKCVRFAS
jgi:diguanylate cyclase (GGDEF)-like protein